MKTNLVPPLGRFVGREALFAWVDARLAAGDRLITILGPGGMGKTRFALRYAELRGEPYLAAGGVWSCDLTEARDAADICAVVARALDLRLSPQLDVESTAEYVGQALAQAGPALLVLDNFEQLVATSARMIEQWCAVAAEACLLVTSRERLGITGEIVLELLPLELPSTGERDTARLVASEAVALFEERARAVGGWDASRSDAADVASLVRELEGIPLAIELAAARSRVLAPGEVLARLRRRARVPGLVGSETTGGPSAAAGSRHATLRAAIDWSWTMLSAAEKSALAQCAVFAGEFSLDAAEQIIDLSDAPGAAVLDVVAALRDKSLLKNVPFENDRGTRFSLYVSIREYAAEKTAQRSDAAALRERHRRYYIDATRAWSDAFARFGDARSRAMLATERENLLAIQRMLGATKPMSTAEAADLARVVLHLEPTIEAESSYEELLTMLTGGIEAAKVAGDGALRGRLLIARGTATGIRGETLTCLADLEVARDLGKSIGDRELHAEALIMAGVRYRQQGRFDDAWSAGVLAAGILEEVDCPRLLGANLVVMGLLLCELGRASESREYNLRARAIFRAADDRWSEGLAIANLAQLDQAAGDFERAALGYDAAIERFRSVGDGRYEGRYLAYRAGLDYERGERDAARVGYASALEWLSASRIRHGEALFRGCLGALEAEEGHAREATIELDQAEDLLASIEAPAFAAALRVHRGHLDLLMARIAQGAGDGTRAAQHEAAARERLRDLPLLASSEDLRFAVRLLERSLARHGSPEPRTPPPPRAGIVVGPDARWFRAGEGSIVDLGRRGALRLVLDALVERRLARPGEAIGWEALLARGWPGERVLASAGATRVRVAVSTLRRLGLAGVLLTRDDGYVLDPRASVRQEPEPTPA